VTTPIHATTQFWGPSQDTTLDTLAFTREKWELSELDRYCFDCPLPECNQKDERCPFSYIHSQRKRNRIAKVVMRMRNKWERELDQAVERIVAEREAT